MRRLLAIALALAPPAFANSNGVVGYSGLQQTTCGSCHNGGGAPSVSFSGPNTLTAGASANYTFTISGGPAVRGGFNVAVDDKIAKLNPVSASAALDFGELHQASPTPFSGGSVSFQFSLTAPAYAATIKLYGCGNSTNGNGGTSGDGTATAVFPITVTAGSGQNPPVITTPATVPSPITSRTAQVSVAANDDGTEANLAYTWSATGPQPVTFSPNGNNAAKQSTATFVGAGAYTFTVTVRDGTNKTVTSTATTQVNTTYSAIRVTPYSVTVPPGGTQQFTASARDQFDVALATQPTFMWSIFGGGTVDQNGLFKAQNAPGGPFAVTVSANNISSASTVGVGQPPPPPADMNPPTVGLTSPAPNTPLTDGVVLAADATDDVGVAQVEFIIGDPPQVIAKASTYPWTATYATVAGLPPGAQPLQARAKDLAGNVALSSAVTVMVPDTGAGGGGGTTGTGGGSTGTGGGTGGANATGGGGIDSANGGCSCGTADGATALLLLAWAARRRAARCRRA